MFLQLVLSVLSTQPRRARPQPGVSRVFPLIIFPMLKCTRKWRVFQPAWWVPHENKDLGDEEVRRLLVWEAVGLTDKETAQDWQSCGGEKPWAHPVLSELRTGTLTYTTLLLLVLLGRSGIGWGFSSWTCTNLFENPTTVVCQLFPMTAQLCEDVVPCSGGWQIWKALLFSVTEVHLDFLRSWPLSLENHKPLGVAVCPSHWLEVPASAHKFHSFVL